MVVCRLMLAWSSRLSSVTSLHWTKSSSDDDASSQDSSLLLLLLISDVEHDYINLKRIIAEYLQ